MAFRNFVRPILLALGLVALSGCGIIGAVPQTVLVADDDRAIRESPAR